MQAKRPLLVMQRYEGKFHSNQRKKIAIFFVIHLLIKIISWQFSLVDTTELTVKRNVQTVKSTEIHWNIILARTLSSDIVRNNYHFPWKALFSTLGLRGACRSREVRAKKITNKKWWDSTVKYQLTCVEIRLIFLLLKALVEWHKSRGQDKKTTQD